MLLSDFFFTNNGLFEEKDQLNNAQTIHSFLVSFALFPPDILKN